MALDHDLGMNTKIDFAKRLAEALDLNRVDSRPIDRKRYIAKAMTVTERHAGNYLSGEKMPTTEGLIELAEKLKVSWEWLATGRGIPTPMEFTPEEMQVLTMLNPMEREKLFQIGKVLTQAQRAA